MHAFTYLFALQRLELINVACLLVLQSSKNSVSIAIAWFIALQNGNFHSLLSFSLDHRDVLRSQIVDSYMDIVI